MNAPEASDGSAEHASQAHAAITALTALAYDYSRKRTFDVVDILEPIACIANAMKGFECLLDELRYEIRYTKALLAAVERADDQCASCRKRPCLGARRALLCEECIEAGVEFGDEKEEGR